MRAAVPTALLLTVFALPSAAQDAPPPKAPRPKLALVLSGGGARGAAHVGVLKVLEELRVPVDVIAGTSMGSIVGGLYAAGLSPQEMEDELASIDWDDAFNDDVPRAQRPYRRKQEESQYLSKLVLGIQNGKVAFPSGLVEGQKLNFILRKLTLHVATVDDFDRLPIPYRTVGTDISTGHKVVLSKGSLADSMRASMAFPGLFAPVEIDGKLLVDGGVSENFPVETAREAGAERLVAVNIGTPLKEKERLGSLVKIVSQVTNVATATNVERSKAAIRPDDVFLEPDLGDLSFMAFTRVRDAVAYGEKAARLKVDQLRPFSVSEEEWAAWLKKTRRPKGPPPTVVSVEMDNPSPLSSAALMAKVKTRPGPLDLETLQADLSRLHALGEFDLVDFRLVPSARGDVLRILIKDRAWGRTSARVGINLQTDFQGESSFELAAMVTRTSLNRLGGEWRVQGGLGWVETVQAELWQPVVEGGWLFVAPAAGWRNERALLSAQGSTFRLDYGKEEVAGRVDVGLTDGTLGEVRLGVSRGYLWVLPRGNDDVFPEIRNDRGSVRAQATLDTRNNVPFPTSGYFFRGDMRWETPTLGADESFRRLFVAGQGSFSYKQNTIQLSALAGSAVGTTLDYYDQFFLGGFRRMSGYRPDSISGPYALFGSVAYLRRIGQLPSVIGGGFYAGGTLEAGNAWRESSDVSLGDLKLCGSVFLGGDTPLGPVYLGLGNGKGGDAILYFLVGLPPF